MLVVSRIAGLLVFTPLLANRSLPRRFRAMIAVMFSAAIYPLLPASVQIDPHASLFELAPLMLSELLIGITIGFLAGLPIIALDMAGFLMGHQMGMGLARVYNPDMGVDTDVISQILMFLGIATFIALGGLEASFSAMVSTFSRVPVGGFDVDRMPLETIVGVIASGVELAIRVALPVLCIVFMLLIGLGFVMKTMPQINVLSVGFSIKILFGLGILAAAIAAVQHAASDEIDRVLKLIVSWGRTVS
jgi:flagellar biosynthetic protein FliR